MRGDEPIAGIPSLDKNIPETYAIARREVDKLNLTGTLAVEGDEYILNLHWNTETIRLKLSGNGKPNQDRNNSDNVAASVTGSLQA